MFNDISKGLDLNQANYSFITTSNQEEITIKYTLTSEGLRIKQNINTNWSFDKIFYKRFSIYKRIMFT